jgi:hypothetical protein
VSPSELRLWLVTFVLAVLAAAGCGRGSGSATTPTGPSAVRTSAGGRVAAAEVRDAFLFDHNARFFDGRTFRWVPPIPIFIHSGDPDFDQFILDQFLAWEAALSGAGGKPFYDPHPGAHRVLHRGIFFVLDDFLFDDTGLTHAFDLSERRRGGARARALRSLAVHEQAQRREIPEILSNGEIHRCAIVLDTGLLDASDVELAYAIRHEVGHCLGFIGHVPRGVMRAFCCSLDITPDVAGMMRTLYTLPPGTAVAP